MMESVYYDLLQDYGRMMCVNKEKQMTTLITLEGLIIRKSGLQGGRPTIAGTGVRVRPIVSHHKLRLSAEEIADEMNLALAGVYATLAYHHLSRVEIEADMIANREALVMEEIIGGRAN
jgi:uncharacterized protein (DUF433 family)